jgi:hypothetical protein
VHAEICDIDHTAVLAQFRVVLRESGAVPGKEIPAPGLQMMFVAIGSQEIVVLRDDLSVDIDGPLELVERIVSKLNGKRGQGS